MLKEQKIVSQDALPDTRPAVLKDKDYSTKEIATSAVAPFQNSKPSKLEATEYNQWYAGSCVPHAFWTQLEYEGIINKDFNPAQLRSYRKRGNYPQAGSNGTDMYDQMRDGQSNDFSTPKYFSEAMATAMPYVRGTKLVKDFKYFQYVDKTSWRTLVEDIPKGVAVGKAISIFIYATEEEWSKEYVDIINPNLNIANAVVRHAVCLTPKGDFTEKGKEWLTVHDSAKFGGRHLRYISYDFLKGRCYFGAEVYLADSIPEPEIPPLSDLPLTYCELGDSSQSVRNLQAFLIKNGNLESKYLTGYYGALTARAVLWWQLEYWTHFTANIPQLLDWGGKYWGSQSIKVLKEINK